MTGLFFCLHGDPCHTGHRNRTIISGSLLPSSTLGDFRCVENGHREAVQLTLMVCRNQEMTLCAGQEHFILYYCVCVSMGTHTEM